MRLIDLDRLGVCKRSVSTFVHSESAKAWNDLLALIEEEPVVDPVHAAGGCYCRECRMRTGVETKETVLCGYHGCSMRKDDFCSMGKREENDG